MPTGVNGIMADKSAITDRLIVQQKAMFRLAAIKGFTQELIHSETGVPTTSLSDWANGKSKISMVGFLAMAEIPSFPTELLSLVMPTGMALVHVPSGVDHDQIERACLDFIACKGDAHHPASPLGREIAPCEDSKLSTKVVTLLRAVA